MIRSQFLLWSLVLLGLLFGRLLQVVHDALPLGQTPHDGRLQVLALLALWVELDSLLRGALHALHNNALLELHRHFFLESLQVVLLG